MIQCNLRILMAKKKVTQKDVIEDTNLSKVTISKLFHEKSTMYGQDTIEKLCIYFNCSIGELFELV